MYHLMNMLTNHISNHLVKFIQKMITYLKLLSYFYLVVIVCPGVCHYHQYTIILFTVFMLSHINPLPYIYVGMHVHLLLHIATINNDTCLSPHVRIFLEMAVRKNKSAQKYFWNLMPLLDSYRVRSILSY